MAATASVYVTRGELIESYIHQPNVFGYLNKAVTATTSSILNCLAGKDTGEAQGPPDWYYVIPIMLAVAIVAKNK